MMELRMARWTVLGAIALVAACSSTPQPQAATPAVDSAAIRARADSLAAAARRSDSLAAAALARARADSLAMAARAARPDSVRAQVLRDGGTEPVMTASGLDAASEALLIEAVYFDFDRSEVRRDQTNKMESKLTLLRGNPRLELQIDGHADERGSDEYNLALGLRRAAAVKRWFTERGTADARLRIHSYGEERPAAQGSNEEAWAQNRRAEFRVTRPAR
jgi:peptidoglycan-associated lipoprotein